MEHGFFGNKKTNQSENQMITFDKHTKIKRLLTFEKHTKQKRQNQRFRRRGKELDYIPPVQFCPVDPGAHRQR